MSPSTADIKQQTKLAHVNAPLQVFLSDFPIRGRHSGFSICSCSYLLYHLCPAQYWKKKKTSTSSMSSFTTSIHLLFGLPLSSFLATPSSASFSQYTHHHSSVHVHTSSVLPLAFSLQTVPSVLSL